jgi:hypothetical protein
MNRLSTIFLLFLTGIFSTGIGAQPGPVPDNQWLLKDYRPVVPVQICDNPRLVSLAEFDVTKEECLAQFDRLFVKCTAELPNVRLPAEFANREEQVAAVSLLYECISVHYIGDAMLEDFNRRYPPEPSSDDGSGD